MFYNPEILLFNNIKINQVNKFPDTEVYRIKNFIEENLPYRSCSGLLSINLGNMKLHKGYNSLFYNDEIFVSSLNSNTTQMTKDLIHEIGHFVEKKYFNVIYGDSIIETEFSSKKERLITTLSSQKIQSFKKIPLKDPQKYDIILNNLLSNKENYKDELLAFRKVSDSLFTSIYSSLNIREYFSNGFEIYFFKSPEEVRKLKELSPKLYKKIEQLDLVLRTK